MGNKKILFVGASYGSLLALKASLAGWDCDLVCLPAEAQAINQEGIFVRMPIRGKEGLLEISSIGAAGKIKALSPGEAQEEIVSGAYGMSALAVTEPQGAHPEIKGLLGVIGAAGLPALSIMNMPPLAFLRRFPAIRADELSACYLDAAAWDQIKPGKIALCSPDPQAFRPADAGPNVLQVRLATNFKSAPFEEPADQEILEKIASSIEEVRWKSPEGEEIALPVKLKAHRSLFVPMAKWAMLMAGNYRCVEETGMIPIKEAVSRDLNETKKVYQAVQRLCVVLGAEELDEVPFEKYAHAAESLGSPSSAARALAAGAKNIERVDLLVNQLLAQNGMDSPECAKISAKVEFWLKKNRGA